MSFVWSACSFEIEQDQYCFYGDSVLFMWKVYKELLTLKVFPCNTTLHCEAGNTVENEDGWSQKNVNYVVGNLLEQCFSASFYLKDPESLQVGANHFSGKKFAC